jgi:hypothetical protein
VKIERITYRHWSTAYRCTSGDAELVIVTEIGPRILSFRSKNGHNLLYEDDTGFQVGDWHLYGGHRFTVAPESALSYVPDNAPCTVESKPDHLRIMANKSANGTERTLVIEPAEDGFDLVHILMNHGPHSWNGAIWAITCIPSGTSIAPRPQSRVRFWPGTRKLDWTFSPRHITSVANGKRGKLGWHSESSWLASIQAHGTLVIHDPNPPTASQCIDNGCNLEIFTCSHYSELETLSGEITLHPGDETSHQQRWRLLPPHATFEQCGLVASTPLTLAHDT